MLVPSGLFPDRQDPVKEKLTQLDQQMKGILERHDIDEYAKATMYSQVLQRYLSLKRKFNEPVTIPIVVQEKGFDTNSWTPTGQVSDDTLTASLLKYIPKTYKTKAKNLLEYIEKAPNVAFNDKGELMVHDRPIRGSNAMDLINDFVRPPTKGQVSQSDPVGWGEFAKALKGMNVPHLLIGNTKRWNHMQLHPSNATITPPPTQPKKRPPSPQAAESSVVARPQKPMPVYKMDVRPRWEPYSK